jgi:FG-GAP-like repeat
LSYIVSNNKKATILTIILLSGGFIGITSPPILSAASAEIYQNAIYDNINFNLNHIEQIQRENQWNSETTDNGQQPSAIEALNIGDSKDAISNIEDTFTGANINDKSSSNLEKNIVNVCINDNDNFLGAELVGGQEQIEPPPPIPPSAFLDLAVTNFFSDNVSILLGDGTGSFDAATNVGTDSAPRYIAISDFNSDRILDLAIANFGSTTVTILLGNGDGSFGKATNFQVGSSPSSIAIGDFNSDRILDLAVTNQGTNNVSILLGNGDGSFGTGTTFLVGDTPTSLSVGDFDKDGKLDLAVANFNSFNISVFLGNDDGTFGTAINTPRK